MYNSIITDQVDQDLEKALSIIQKNGYKAIELHNVFSKSIESCSNEEVYQIRDLLDVYSMKVSNISSTIFFLCPLYEKDQVSLFNDTFHAVYGTVEDHLNFLKRACWIANVLGCPRIRLFPFRFPDNRKPPFGIKEDRDRIMDALQKAVSIAKAQDVTLVLENCPYSHLPKGQMTYEVVKMINEDHLRLLWDPGNSYRAIKENVPHEYLEISLLEELDQIYPYIDHIHIKDYHYVSNLKKPFVHKAFGSGDIDYASLFDSLKEHGYDKALSLEPEVSFEETLQSMERLKKRF
ncbi:MAG: sugar phosphate isomerase/epimerase family protein [Porphyromonadaceae bacterium]|nr:sugar phosphate isomerase/epimerase family protein [Porphyromonadaceae bacterium]